MLIGRYVVGILIERFSSEAAFEHADWIQNHARSNFSQFSVLIQHLKVSKPNSVVSDGEVENMVNEWLTLGMIVGGGKGLNEQFFHQLPMWLCIKLLVKLENWSGALQTISCHLQLRHCVNIFYKKLHRRTFRRIRQPHVKIHFLFGFKEHDFPAVFHLTDLIDYKELVFTIHLCIGFRMRHHGAEIIHEMTVLM